MAKQRQDDPGGDDACLAFLREADRDRYLACLLTPADRRADVAALYAFNAEIARVRDLIREPMPGEIRLQWWREVINGERAGEGRAHPIAARLLSAIDAHALPVASFDRYIEARIFDLYDDPMSDRTVLEAYAGETVSTLIQLSAMVLDRDAAPTAADAAGHGGVALCISGLLQLAAIHRARGQVYVPAEILSATGLDRDAFLGGADRRRTAAAFDAMIALGRDHLVKARAAAATLAPSLFPAFLPVALAEPVFDRAARAGAALLDAPLAFPQWRRQWTLWRAQARRAF